MGTLVDNKFTWVIQNFDSLQSNKITSDQFVVGGCKWELIVYPKGGNKVGYLPLYLKVTEYESLPCSWRREAKVIFTLVNQLSEELSEKEEVQVRWFNDKSYSWGFVDMLLLTKLHERDSGFLVNGQLKITAEVDVLEVIGRVVESEGETSQPLKKRKQDNDFVLPSEVNGFLLLPSQMDSLERIFEKHPNMALQLRGKKQTVKIACMNVLLSLIDTLCQSMQDLSIDDLSQAENALTYLKNSGLKVDWLEGKLEEVKEKKMEEEIGKTRIQELEEKLKCFKQKYSDTEALLEKKKEELKDLKQKCSDTEALLKKEKAEVLATRTPPLALDDVV
ncbi:hypothetical protein AALP_AA3G352100 [Arabis alpina]|uniref:MATH domain-containing protein n=1 Tax=Arabis alpina TaxID=50452 RepID=A0A087HDR3_ARAAL|nr:hypothetical protein AALP_AA3G352100 [Arabis alpina]